MKWADHNLFVNVQCLFTGFLDTSEPLSTHIQRPYVAWFVCVLHYTINYVKTDNTACWTKTLWHSLAYCWDPVDVLTIQTLLLLQPVNLEKCMISKYTKYSSNFDCWPFGLGWPGTLMFLIFIIEQDPQNILLASNDLDPQNPPDDFKGAEECLHGEDTTLVTSPKVSHLSN